MAREIKFRLNESEVRNEGLNAATFYAHDEVLSEAERELKKRALDDEEMVYVRDAANYMSRSNNPRLAERGAKVLKTAEDSYKKEQERKRKIRSAIAAAQGVRGGEIRSVRTYGGSSTAAKGNSNT